jgi:hypothetical protein
MEKRRIDLNAAAVALASAALATVLAAALEARADSPAPTTPAATVTVLHCGHLLDSVGGKLLGAGRGGDRARRSDVSAGSHR